MISSTIFWICIGLLVAILVIAMIGIDKAVKDSLTSENVVCAGSVDNSYPATVKIKLPFDPIRKDKSISEEEINSLNRFIVKGNSMQYAQINSDDIIYVKSIDLDTLRRELPKVTLLEFIPNAEGKAYNKIRRTWSIIDTCISTEDFENTLVSVLNSNKFAELRRQMGEKCPADNQLKAMAKQRLLKYRKSLSDNTPHQNPKLLLSTTFRTEKNQLEFSIHPASSFKGVIAYVCHPIISSEGK